MKFINNLRYLFAIPKSMYVNLRLLPFLQAIKLPIIVSNKTKLSSLKGNVYLKRVKTGIVRIGFGSIKLIDYNYNRTILHIDGSIEFDGKCKIGQGSRIEVQKNGILKFGNNFIISGGAKIICSDLISFGDSCLVSWDTLFMDTDQHDILDNKCEIINHDQKIIIGEKVWVGTRSTILKGSTIPKGCIIGAASLISSKYVIPNTILAGVPAKVIKENITW